MKYDYDAMEGMPKLVGESNGRRAGYGNTRNAIGDFGSGWNGRAGSPLVIQDDNNGE